MHEQPPPGNQELLEQLRAVYGVPPALVLDYEQAVAHKLLDEWAAFLRSVGRILLENGRADLWRLVYMEYCTAQAAPYEQGDEMTFVQQAAPGSL